MQPGDRVRIVDTVYTRSHGPRLASSIGMAAEITAVIDCSAASDCTSFDTLYQVRLGRDAFDLLAADLHLVQRPARILS
jgi:hypothetical protein